MLVALCRASGTRAPSRRAPPIAATPATSPLVAIVARRALATDPPAGLASADDTRVITTARATAPRTAPDATLTWPAPSSASSMTPAMLVVAVALGATLMLASTSAPAAAAAAPSSSSRTTHGPIINTEHDILLESPEITSPSLVEVYAQLRSWLLPGHPGSYLLTHAASRVAKGRVPEYWFNQTNANEPIEDDHFEELQFASSATGQGSYFAMFDGHSGPSCAQVAGKNLHAYLRAELDTPRPKTDLKTQAGRVDHVAKCLRRAFLRFDRDFLDESVAQKRWDVGRSGACALVSYVLPAPAGATGANANDVLLVANAGDCRAVLGRREADGSWRAIALSTDFQGSTGSEMRRLRLSHPTEDDVAAHGRIKGGLEPSRGLGDGLYKRKEFNEHFRRRTGVWTLPYTTADPEVRAHVLDAKHDEFLLMFTDGVSMWMGNDEAVRTVGAYLDLVQAERAQPAKADVAALDAAQRAAVLNPATLLLADVMDRVCARTGLPPAAVGTVTRLSKVDRRNIMDDTSITVVRLK